MLELNENACPLAAEMVAKNCNFLGNSSFFNAERTMAVADLPPKNPFGPSRKRSVFGAVCILIFAGHIIIFAVYILSSPNTLSAVYTLLFLFLRFRIWRRRNAHFCEEERIRPAVYTLLGSTGRAPGAGQRTAGSRRGKQNQWRGDGENTK